MALTNESIQLHPPTPFSFPFPFFYYVSSFPPLSPCVQWKLRWRERRGEERKAAMEFYEELLLTALISVLLAFLIGKLAAAGATEDEADHQSATLSTAPPARADVKLERGEGSLLIEQVAEKLGSSVVAFETEVNDDRLERIKELETENRDKVGEVRMEESSGKELDKEVEIERIGDAGSCREGRRLVKEEVVVEKVVEEVIVQLGGEEEVEVTEDVAVSGGDERGGSFLHGEDEWEGIERSELEKLFGVAIDYVGGKKGRETVSKLSSEVQMQLYGLHKIATEGPCYEPQPMALKVTARAKWYCSSLVMSD